MNITFNSQNLPFISYCTGILWAVSLFSYWISLSFRWWLLRFLTQDAMCVWLIMWLEVQKSSLISMFTVSHRWTFEWKIRFIRRETTFGDKRCLHFLSCVIPDNLMKHEYFYFSAKEILLAFWVIFFFLPFFFQFLPLLLAWVPRM